MPWREIDGTQNSGEKSVKNKLRERNLGDKKNKGIKKGNWGYIWERNTEDKSRRGLELGIGGKMEEGERKWEMKRVRKPIIHISTALHCTALHSPALHCTELHCTALHLTPLHCIALHCTALH